MAKILTSVILKKNHDFLRKTHLFFKKKTEILNVLRILQFLSDSLEKLMSRSDVNKNAEVGVWHKRNWQTSGGKNWEIGHLRGRFCLRILKNLTQNNKMKAFVQKKSLNFQGAMKTCEEPVNCLLL